VRLVLENLLVAMLRYSWEEKIRTDPPSLAFSANMDTSGWSYWSHGR
jgi:hypothetical protein